MRLPLFRQVMKAPRRFSKEFEMLPPKLKVRVVEIMEEHGGRNFNMVALTGGKVDKGQFRVRFTLTLVTLITRHCFDLITRIRAPFTLTLTHFCTALIKL